MNEPILITLLRKIKTLSQDELLKIANILKLTEFEYNYLLQLLKKY